MMDLSGLGVENTLYGLFAGASLTIGLFFKKKAYDIKHHYSNSLDGTKKIKNTLDNDVIFPLLNELHDYFCEFKREEPRLSYGDFLYAMVSLNPAQASRLNNYYSRLETEYYTRYMIKVAALSHIHFVDKCGNLFIVILLLSIIGIGAQFYPFTIFLVNDYPVRLSTVPMFLISFFILLFFIWSIKDNKCKYFLEKLEIN